jgi:hypothetical protein
MRLIWFCRSSKTADRDGASDHAYSLMITATGIMEATDAKPARDKMLIFKRS